MGEFVKKENGQNMQDQPIKFAVTEVWKNLAFVETTAGDQIVLRQRGKFLISGPMDGS